MQLATAMKLKVVRAGTVAALALLAGGCEELGLSSKKIRPQPIEYALMSPYGQVQTVAIAPAINVSGSKDFDALVVSDTMHAEMQQVHGLTVLPVNKTIAAMQQMRLRSIDSPQTARAIAQALNADAILLVSVTAYDPYMPPKVGMTVQLYTVRDAAEVTGMTARRVDGSVIVAAPPAEARPERYLAASLAAVFDSSNQSVRVELRDFARGRTDPDSALKEERFMADADAYMRFVCHAMVRRLMEVERSRVAGR